MTAAVAAPSTSRAGAALRTVVALTAAGAALGALWAWLAPPAHGVVALTKSGDRVHAYLGTEADHFFVAAFLMLGMLCVLAVVGSAAVWQWRAHRGPVLLVALCLGVGGGAVAAMALGSVLVGARYDAIDIAGAPVSPDHRVHYVTEAPAVFFGQTPLQVAITLLVPVATAALVYAVCAVASPRDDLGGYPPVEGVVLGAPAVTVDGG
ncbi:DUF2567 domain-containing protein [[Mycobacterium] wendilense]|uniref:DUF2567 domain-containing protein n=1 Tax=[Mycobacterium] wendilense TaxID=3064284 RepID=A0ABN9NZ43_9MYCO|nr:DUF2567 domain-containing protein [Mycolicibacterium sp. MU0050]CAJ1583149.1 DUF2567 domain-containing protein [Mycolicibacterium sp. MU0050]